MNLHLIILDVILFYFSQNKNGGSFYKSENNLKMN